MFVEISVLIVCLFIILILFSEITSTLSNISGLFYLPLVIVTPFVLVLGGYLYMLVLEFFFSVSKADSISVFRFGFAWFIVLSVLLMFGSFAPTHQTKSGKADKRYKDNPAVNAPFGWFIFLVLAWGGTLIYLANKFEIYPLLFALPK